MGRKRSKQPSNASPPFRAAEIMAGYPLGENERRTVDQVADQPRGTAVSTALDELSSRGWNPKLEPTATADIVAFDPKNGRRILIELKNVGGKRSRADWRHPKSEMADFRIFIQSATDHEPTFWIVPKADDESSAPEDLEEFRNRWDLLDVKSETGTESPA
jgi:hypothetical protein